MMKNYEYRRLRFMHVSLPSNFLCPQNVRVPTASITNMAALDANVIDNYIRQLLHSSSIAGTISIIKEISLVVPDYLTAIMLHLDADGNLNSCPLIKNMRGNSLCLFSTILETAVKVRQLMGLLFGRIQGKTILQHAIISQNHTVISAINDSVVSLGEAILRHRNTTDRQHIATADYLHKKTKEKLVLIWNAEDDEHQNALAYAIKQDYYTAISLYLETIFNFGSSNNTNLEDWTFKEALLYRGSGMDSLLAYSYHHSPAIFLKIIKYAAIHSNPSLVKQALAFCNIDYVF